MTVAEGPRDRARRETQLELNWSVLARAFGRVKDEGGQEEGRMANEQNFPGVSVGGDQEQEIVPGRRRRRVRLPEINVISFAVAEKIQAQESTDYRSFPFCKATCSSADNHFFLTQHLL